MPSYITDRPSLAAPQRRFLWIQGGTLLCPSRSHYTWLRALMWLQIENVQTPSPQPHGPAQRRLHPVVSSLWKNIFECLVHSLTVFPPSNFTCCSHLDGFLYSWRGESGGDESLWRDAHSASFVWSFGQKVLVGSGRRWKKRGALIRDRTEVALVSVTKYEKSWANFPSTDSIMRGTAFWNVLLMLRTW